MFFKGFFFSLLSFIVIVGVTACIGRLERHIARRILWLILLIIGIILLFTALWISSFWLSIIFCTAAITFLYAASQLRQTALCRCPPNRFGRPGRR